RKKNTRATGSNGPKMPTSPPWCLTTVNRLTKQGCRRATERLRFNKSTANGRVLPMTVLAHEIMTPTIKAVPHHWTMDRLARFLTDNEITGSPVTDDNGDIIGIATLKDITEFRWNATRAEDQPKLTPEEQEEARRLRMVIFEEMGKVPVEVRDIMTPLVLSV